MDIKKYANFHGDETDWLPNVKFILWMICKFDKLGTWSLFLFYAQFKSSNVLSSTTIFIQSLSIDSVRENSKIQASAQVAQTKYK